MYKYSNGSRNERNNHTRITTISGAGMSHVSTVGKVKQFLKSAFLGMVLGVIIPCLAFGQASLLPNATLQYLDGSGRPVASGQVYYYIPSTSTLKTVWQDAAQTVPQANPVQLNAFGYPQPAGQTFGSGCYRQKVVDQNTITIWDAVTCSTGSGGGGGVTPTYTGGVMVGTIIPWAGVTLPNLYLYAAGQALTRTSYPELFVALTIPLNVLCQAGIASITVSAAISDIVPIGTPIESVCFAPGTVVSSKITGQLTFNNAATITTSTASVLFPWGDGNGTTTFNVPDLRGRAYLGRDNMNSVAAARITSTYFGNNPDAIGAPGGSQTQTLLLANLPPHTHTSPTLTDPGHIHGSNANLNAPSAAVGSGAFVGPQLGTANISVGFTGITLSASTGTNASGTSTPFSILQPAITSDYIIKALPDALPSGSGVTSIGGMIGNISCGTNVSCAGNVISVNTTFGAHTVLNSNLVQENPATIKGNPTGSLADVQDFSIQGLPDVVALNLVSDQFLVWQQATGLFKSVTATEIFATNGGVTSLNTLKGNLTLLAGANVTITPGAGTLTIGATGGGGGSGCSTPGSGNAFCGGGGNGTLTGSNNTAVNVSLTSITSGNNNTAYGYAAGHSLTGSSGDTLIGYAAGFNITTGVFPISTNNTFVGAQAGYGCTTCQYNTAVGLFAMQWTTTNAADENTAIGATALLSNTTGTHNTAVGANALGGDYDPIGVHGTAITGSENVAVGYNTLLAATTAAQNVCVGAQSCAAYAPSSFTGSNNVGIGWSSLPAMATTANGNIALGTLSGANVTTGTNNILEGFYAGKGITTGSNNILIGQNTVPNTCAGAIVNAVAIGNNINCALLGSNTITIADGAGNQRITVDSTGKTTLQNVLGWGTSANTSDGAQRLGSTANLSVNNLSNIDPSLGTFIYIFNSSGQMCAFTLNAGLNTTNKIFDPSSVCGTAAGSAATNVYKSGSFYVVQNNTGGVQSYTIRYLTVG